MNGGRRDHDRQERLLAVLRDANPVPDEAALPGPDDAAGTALLERILADADGGEGRAWRPLLPAVAALALVAATVVALLTRDVTDPTTVACYEEPHLEADTAVVGADGDDAVAACAEVWAEGAFGTPAVPDALTECVLETGVVAVFPVDDCSQVTRTPAATPSPSTPGPSASAPGAPTSPSPAPPAAPPPDDEHRANAAEFAAVRDRLVERFLDEPCMDESTATAAIREVVTGTALERWEVRPNAPFTSARPCASLAFDAEGQAILLAPIPPPPSP